MAGARISNKQLLGFTGRRTIPTGGAIIRKEIFGPSGAYVGTVVYVRRRLPAGGSVYGWRPECNTRARLTNQVGAIEALGLLAA